jgi:arylsulfatase A-like enzyme
MFRLLDEAFNQVAYTQNVYADTLLYQFEQHLDRHLPLDSFTLTGNVYYDNLFPNDAIYGLKSVDQFLLKREEAHGSLFLSILNDLGTQFTTQLNSERLKQEYPNGLPRIANTDVYFQLDQVMNGVMSLLNGLTQPSLAYIHLMPPHAPYTPSQPYLELFDDGWAPPPKKKHRLAAGISEERLAELRRTYDQFVANLDNEFGRLLDSMESSGLLENSYVILTSDHGEIFERGAHGKSKQRVGERDIRVPLMIAAPGQCLGQDVALTSNVDLLPSLLHIAGLPAPD